MLKSLPRVSHRANAFSTLLEDWLLSSSSLLLAGEVTEGEQAAKTFSAACQLHDFAQERFGFLTRLGRGAGAPLILPLTRGREGWGLPDCL